MICRETSSSPTQMAPAMAVKGRIRLTKEQAALLKLILEEQLSMQWGARAGAPEMGLPRSTMNRSIRLTRKMLDELGRTTQELGW